MTKELGGSGPQKWKTSPHAWASGGGGGDSALPRRKRTNKKADRRGRRKAYGDWVKFAGADQHPVGADTPGADASPIH